MLTIYVGGNELFDPEESRFIKVPARKLTLEHSLKSLAKWESKWKIPFLSSKITEEQSIDYIRCMETTGQVKDEIFKSLTKDQITEIDAYINDKMTATTIKQRGPKKPSKEIITAEVIYFWMIQLGIPPEYEKWHLNRLLMLIEVCTVKGGPQQKMSRQEQMAMQRALNAERKSKLHTRG